MENALNWAREQDTLDTLNHFRTEFYFPQHAGKDVLYFTGNSLGLQPKGVQSSIQEELDAWKTFGVEGHFEAKRPWFNYHEFFTESLAKLWVRKVQKWFA